MGGPGSGRTGGGGASDSDGGSRGKTSHSRYDKKSAGAVKASLAFGAINKNASRAGKPPGGRGNTVSKRK